MARKKLRDLIPIGDDAGTPDDKWVEGQARQLSVERRRVLKFVLQGVDSGRVGFDCLRWERERLSTTTEPREVVNVDFSIPDIVVGCQDADVDGWTFSVAEAAKIFVRGSDDFVRLTATGRRFLRHLDTLVPDTVFGPYPRKPF